MREKYCPNMTKEKVNNEERQSKENNVNEHNPNFFENHKSIIFMSLFVFSLILEAVITGLSIYIIIEFIEDTLVKSALSLGITVSLALTLNLSINVSIKSYNNFVLNYKMQTLNNTINKIDSSYNLLKIMGEQNLITNKVNNLENLNINLDGSMKNEKLNELDYQIFEKINDSLHDFIQAVAMNGNTFMVKVYGDYFEKVEDLVHELSMPNNLVICSKKLDGCYQELIQSLVNFVSAFNEAMVYRKDENYFIAEYFWTDKDFRRGRISREINDQAYNNLQILNQSYLNLLDSYIKFCESYKKS